MSNQTTHIDPETTIKALRKKITRLEKALAQPQQEPVAWMSNHAVGFRKSEFGATPTVPLYTSPPARKPLTDEQVLDCWKQAYEPGRREHDNATRIARAIEAKHNIKGDA